MTRMPLFVSLALACGLFLIVLLPSCQHTDSHAAVAMAQLPRDTSLLYDTSDAALAHRIDTFFLHQHQAGYFNGVVLYARQGKIVYEGQYGWRDFTTRAPLQLTDAFELGSVSKPLTAITVLKLIEAGKINLDDSLQVYFPRFPYQGITVRHLLSHRSGLGNYMYFIDNIWPNKDSAISNVMMLNYMVRDTPQVYYPPNTKYNYCNTNYALLANLIEQVTQMPYAAYLDQVMFSPLGMHQATVHNRCHERGFPSLVRGHNAYFRHKENSYLNGVVGDKGIYASVYDLYRLDRGLYDTTYFSPQLLQLMHTPQHEELAARQQDNYGLGWRLKSDTTHGQVVYHNGWWKGFKTYYIRMIDKEQTIIILSNVTRGGFLSNDTLQRLWDDPHPML